MTPTIAVVYGLGGSWLDPTTGERSLVARLKAIGVNTGEGPYDYTDSKGIYALLSAAQGFRGIIGDSLGASYAPNYASALAPRKVDYIAGFQPSIYATDVEDLNEITIPENVITAHCVRDPYWIQTGGLGYGIYVKVAGSATRIITTEHDGAHPDDYGYAQDLIFNEVKGMIS